MRPLGAAGSILLVVLCAGCSSPAQDQLEANKALVRQMGETIDAEDWNGLDALVTEDFHRHSQASTDLPEITSREEFKDFERGLHAAFSNMHVTYEMMVAEGDMVTAYAMFTGTNTGPIGELPATGRSVLVSFLAMFRIEDAKVAEIWVEWDNLDRMVQLGLWPPQASDGN